MNFCYNSVTVKYLPNPKSACHNLLHYSIECYHFSQALLIIPPQNLVFLLTSRQQRMSYYLLNATSDNHYLIHPSIVSSKFYFLLHSISQCYYLLKLSSEYYYLLYHRSESFTLALNLTSGRVSECEDSLLWQECCDS